VAEGNAAATAEQRRQFDLGRQDLEPFRDAGVSALGQQMAFLGLGNGSSSGGSRTLNPAFTQFENQRNSLQSRLGNSSSGHTLQGIPLVLENDRRRSLGMAPLLSPNEARAEQSQIQNQLNALGSGPQQFITSGGSQGNPAGFGSAFQQFVDSPGQQFLRQRQEKSLLRNSGAIGGLGGGNVRTALQDQAFGRSATQLGDFQNRLAGISGMGQQATQTGAQLGQQSANNISSLAQNTGQAQSSGILAGQQANAGTASSLIGLGSMLFSDARLKDNLVKVGEMESGLNIYTWTWNDLAKDIVGEQPEFGVIAQEAEKLFPNAVSEENGYLHVNYAELK
tara:strand:+ start:28283 stop:29293 length:1011 start_codon:yes stop_codon:yes gene_type:complete